MAIMITISSLLTVSCEVLVDNPDVLFEHVNLKGQRSRSGQKIQCFLS